MRAKNIRIAWCRSTVGLDASAEREKNRELAEYKSARDQGIQPAGTRTAQTRFALEQSDKIGRPWQAAGTAEEQ